LQNSDASLAMFEEVGRPIISSAMDGYNGTIGRQLTRPHTLILPMAATREANTHTWRRFNPARTRPQIAARASQLRLWAAAGPSSDTGGTKPKRDASADTAAGSCPVRDGCNEPVLMDRAHATRQADRTASYLNQRYGRSLSTPAIAEVLIELARGQPVHDASIGPFLIGLVSGEAFAPRRAVDGYVTPILAVLAALVRRRVVVAIILVRGKAVAPAKAMVAAAVWSPKLVPQIPCKR